MGHSFTLYSTLQDYKLYIYVRSLFFIVFFRLIIINN